MMKLEKYPKDFNQNNLRHSYMIYNAYINHASQLIAE